MECLAGHLKSFQRSPIHFLSAKQMAFAFTVFLVNENYRNTISSCVLGVSFFFFLSS